MLLDCAVIGGGPAGLAATLVLGRSRKRVALFDGGTPRNATASYIGGFITQDRISPAEFRRTAHVDLRAYPTVELHLNTLVTRIERAGPKLRVHAGGVAHEARRVLVCTGVQDEPLPLEGSRELWGASLFQCPYCHAWEHHDERFAYLATSPEEAAWAQVLRSWTNNVMILTNGAFELPRDLCERLREASILVEERRILRLASERRQLTAIVVEGGVEVPRDVLFFRPVQRLTPVVAALALATADGGYVRVDEQYRTSIPTIYAAGDLVTHYHGALAAADAGSRAAHCINHELTLALVADGQL